MDLNLPINTQIINNSDLNKFLIYSGVIKVVSTIITNSQRSCRTQSISNEIIIWTAIHNTNINYYCCYRYISESIINKISLALFNDHDHSRVALFLIQFNLKIKDNNHTYLTNYLDFIISTEPKY